MNERIKQEIEEMEKELSALISQRAQLQQQIDALRLKINNKKVYDKYCRGSRKTTHDGKTCEELIGKPHCSLTDEELREYWKIKQAERRARIKREKERANERNLETD